jgi:general secretion pathway protein D
MSARRKLQFCGRLLLLALLLAWLAQHSAQAAPRSKTGGAPPASAATPPASPGDLLLTQVRLDEAVRLLAQIAKTNIVVTGKVSDIVLSLYLRNSSVDDMVRNLCRAAGVWFRYDSASKTYIIMNGDEYQKDLAIIRDEQTRIFTLRHHNVVATANAIKALFGNRVQLQIPIEEAPPISLGSGSRTSTSSSRTTSGSGSSSRSSGGSSTLAAANVAAVTPASASRGGSAANYDASADLKRMSLDRLGGQLRTDGNGQPVLSVSEIQELAAIQGAPIYVTYNKLNNLLLVRTGDEASLKQIAQLISDMDLPPRQVLLEMKILEVTLDNGFKSVFDIGASTQGTTSGPLPSGALASTTSTYARNSLATGLFDVESDATAIWQIMSNSLSLRFQLLAQENKLKVLSSPMLVAANNQTARLFIGDEQVLTVGASSESITGTTGATNTTITVDTEQRDVGQTLSILPRINGDRSVSLTIDQDSSTVKKGDTTIPISTGDGNVIYFPIDTVNTANLQVTAHAQDGMTVAIGGMIRDSIQRDEQKVPMLGDIPVLGTFFKRDVRASVRSQIILLITPRVLESPDESNRLAQTKTQDYEALSASIPTTSIPPKFGQNTPVERPVTATMVTPGTAAPTAAAPSERTADATYAALARSAAAAVRQPDPTKAAPDGLLAVAVVDRSGLKLANGMEARPGGSWQRDGLYVTALKVINLAAQPGNVAPTLIRGRWAAMVLERSQLDPAGSANSWTWAYAVSRQPFEQSIERP